MFEVGRVCIKIAGRDSNNPCVVIDVIDSQYVMIAGATRRRKCNVKHLEPTEKIVKIKKNAPFSEVAAVFKELGHVLKETKPKKATKRPTKSHVKKASQTKDSPGTKEKPKSAKEAKKPATKPQEKKVEPKTAEVKKTAPKAKAPAKPAKAETPKAKPKK